MNSPAERRNANGMPVRASPASFLPIFNWLNWRRRARPPAGSRCAGRTHVEADRVSRGLFGSPSIQAHARDFLMLRLWVVAPKGQSQIGPGQRPGTTSSSQARALKVRYRIRFLGGLRARKSRDLRRPYRAFPFLDSPFPRALPRAGMLFPLRGGIPKRRGHRTLPWAGMLFPLRGGIQSGEDTGRCPGLACRFPFGAACQSGEDSHRKRYECKRRQALLWRADFGADLVQARTFSLGIRWDQPRLRIASSPEPPCPR